ncbi:MAG: hypothetical protein P4L85_15475, partial [Paludisphaera borealis]|uniref:hypothetical protein n=1 Tax=Paludisphaera borealis TaxID=1387353 RepID=UPI0028513045
MKSQDLLERVQEWGLDVKANPLASLDPPTVERIRELMNQQSTGTQASGVAAPPARPPAAPEASSPPPVKPAVSPAPPAAPAPAPPT